MTITASAPTTRRRTIPTARLVLPATARRAVILAERRNGISSSDVPLIMDTAEKGSPLAAYCDKAGLLPLERPAGEPALWGSVFKDPIARVWSDRAGASVRRVGLVENLDEPWMRASLDRLVTGCPLARARRETCALHIYTRDAHKAYQWTTGVPDPVRDQLLWKIAVTGLDHIHVMVVIGGNDGRRYTVRRAEHEQRLAQILAGAREFWFDHITRRIPPTPTGAERPEELLALYRELYPHREDVVDLDDCAAEVKADLNAYQGASAAESAAGKDRKQALLQLVQRLGGAKTALVNGEEAYSLRSQASQRHTDLEQLAEDYPAAYAACVTRGDDHVRLNIAKTYRLE